MNKVLLFSLRLGSPNSLQYKRLERGEVEVYQMHCRLEVGYFTNRGKESNTKKNITFRKLVAERGY